ncbi:MAG: DUF3488 domain-containing transglutaminase family protein [Rhodocyclaceae bacterium]|nr:DUF3488 domain-containing transglutaminase family protein [Rhodocyclaceae bacterium]
MSASTDLDLPRQVRLWMLATAALTLLPHLLYLPLWLGAVTTLVLLWYAERMRRDISAPRRLVMFLLAGSAAGLILSQYGTLLGKSAGIALLALLLSLKLLESRRARDAQVFVLLCFFLQTGLFLDTQSALTAGGAALGALLATTTLASLQTRDSPPRQLRLAATLLIQSLPFMVVLFVLFPRIPGPLWGLPGDAFSATTGLSDAMEPGSISQLSQSAEIAFRVSFDTPLPPPAQRYWRGPVLSAFDGRRWTRPDQIARRTPPYAPQGEAVRYEMTLEAHNRHWLLALDYPAAGIPGALHSASFEALSRHPVHQRTRYRAASHPLTRVGVTQDDATLLGALHLPAGNNPRTRALADTLRDQHRSPEAIVEAAIGWMRSADLIYTLRPPLLGEHSADTFLFDTRKGFCEHFAGSFAVLMRAAGIPARVVTGYQGGEINAYDGTLVVRQSDAHAWTEVWLAGHGWLRVDPTAASAPRRIDGGLAAALPDGEPVPFMVGTDLAWLRGLRDRWEFLGNAWNQWVLGYDQQRQQSLLRRIGLDAVDWRAQGAAMLVATGVLFAALLAWAHARARTRDPLLRQWQRFEHKLARLGTARLPSEGPADYADRAAQAHPAARCEIIAIAQRYAALRYGKSPPDATAIKALALRIHRLRIQCS